MSTKEILSRLSASSSHTVSDLRSLIFSKASSDDKKLFKQSCKSLEEDGKISINEDGVITLLSSSSSSSSSDKSEKKEKKEKKDKKERKAEKDAVSSEEEADEDESSKKKRKDELDAEPSSSSSSSSSSKKSKNSVPDDYTAPGASSSSNVPVSGNRSGVTRLFVGNLPFAVTSELLSSALPVPPTHIKWITDKESGKFYGSAFIEMPTSASAKAAVDVSEKAEILGRLMKVNFAPAREGDVWPPPAKETSGGMKGNAGGEEGGDGAKAGGDAGGKRTTGGAAGGYGIKSLGPRPEGCKKLFVGNLSYDVDDDKMFQFFKDGAAVDVRAIRWIHHKDSGDFKGVGYVEFWREEDCEKAAKMNGKELLKRPIRIDWTD